MKIDLKDTTFLIPVRLDSIIRLENLLAVVNYIHSNFSTHIMILEASSYNNGLISSILKRKVEYYFVEDKDSVFYRTKYLNIMTNKVQTPFLAIWDADVIIDKKQIEDSLNFLRFQSIDIAFPYDGEALDTSEIIRSYYFRKKRIDILRKNKLKMSSMYGGITYGGAIIVNVEKYRYSGAENEAFYGWGPEDAERFYRWKILDFKIYRSPGCLFHLSHPRDLNGTIRSLSQDNKTTNELIDTVSCSKEEILYKMSFNKT